MPRFVHITDEKNARRIERGGIKIGKVSGGLFCMPVTYDFFVSHQWMRELKRSGAKTLVGVYFKLKSDEKVWFGKYTGNHQLKEAGEALKEFKNVADKLGCEFFIERKIEASEILKIKSLPQNVGWRYSPNSHETKLSCGCPICIPRGGIRSRKKREKFEPPVKKRSLEEIAVLLRTETNDQKIDELFWQVRRKKRRSNPDIFRFILDKNDKEMIRLLAFSLATFQHKNTIGLLVDLCKIEDRRTKENSVKSLFELKGEATFEILTEFKDDEIISELLNKPNNL